MSFNELCGALVCRLRPLLGDAPSVCEFGNQKFRARAVARQSLRHMPSSTLEFYRELGFASYLAIDVNENMNAVAMDLNEPLDERYGWKRTFSLVTNNGTGEHIFDQRAVLRNAHNLCAVNGIMLHIMPFQGWVNHGFYNFHPQLYLDLARSNGYNIVMSGVGTTKGGFIELAGKDFGRAVKRDDTSSAMAQAIDSLKSRDLMVCAALQKRHDGPFAVPIQGKYVGAIESEEIEKRYAPDRH